jgi:redox-sensitive bicupin YhaK (pirin superfamily)
MPATLFTNESRGGGNHDWLRTKYSYSFANYYDPERMGFGALRVVNDDWIAPGAGFPTHPHQNMEIITIPLVGSLAHKDDAGGKGEVGVGMVQVMSAGTGVLHSEYNASPTEPVELFQIWIEPKSYHVAPRYQEAEYSHDTEKTGSTLLVGPEGKRDTWIHQDAYISRISVVAGEEYTHPLQNPAHGVYLLVIEGEGKIFGYDLKKRDALEIAEEGKVIIQATQTMDILCIEVPLV